MSEYCMFCDASDNGDAVEIMLIVDNGRGNLKVPVDVCEACENDIQRNGIVTKHFTNAERETKRQEDNDRFNNADRSRVKAMYGF